MPRLATDHWKRAPTIMRIRSTPWLIVAHRAARQLHPRCGPRRLAARSNIPGGCPCRSSSQPPNFSETPVSPPGYQRYSHPLHSGRRFRLPPGKSRATASTNFVSKRSWTISRPSPISHPLQGRRLGARSVRGERLHARGLRRLLEICVQGCEGQAGSQGQLQIGRVVRR